MGRNQVRFGTASLQVEAGSGSISTVADDYELAEDSALQVSADQGVLANDNPWSSAQAVVVVPPRNGRLAFRADGSFAYQPFANVAGIDRFQYVVVDQNQTSARTLVTLQITPKADGPLTKPESYRVVPGSPLSIPTARGVLVNDLDPDGDGLSARLESPPANGTVVLHADGSFVYTSADGFAGTDRFTYRAFDGTYVSAPTAVELSTMRDGAVLKFQLDAVNFQGTPIHALSVGSEFQLLVRAQDLRADGLGLLSAAVTIPIDTNAMEVINVELDPLFSLFGFASVEDGLVQLGGSTGFNPLTRNELVGLGKVTLRVRESQEDVVIAALADATSENYLTGYALNGEELSVVADNLIEFVPTVVDLVPATDPSNPRSSRWQNADPFDVDNNGLVQTVDAARVISMINYLSANASAEGPDRMERYAVSNLFSDINGDFDTTPQDGILLINYLNSQLKQSRTAVASAPSPPIADRPEADLSRNGEGESGGLGSQGGIRASSRATVTERDNAAKRVDAVWINPVFLEELSAALISPLTRRNTKLRNRSSAETLGHLLGGSRFGM